MGLKGVLETPRDWICDVGKIDSPECVYLEAGDQVNNHPDVQVQWSLPPEPSPVCLGIYVDQFLPIITPGFPPLSEF